MSTHTIETEAPALVPAPKPAAPTAPTVAGSHEASSYVTRFGSLESFDKGGVEIINDDPRHYAFSNVFEVASHARPYEKIAVGKNMEYVLEAVRAEGVSEWRTSGHDEFVLVMDGRVVIDLVKLDDPPLPVAAPSESPAVALEGSPEGSPSDTTEDSDGGEAQGSIALAGEPVGRRMGRVTAARGHMTLLPAGAAYRFSADQPGVLLMQTVAGPDTQFRWAEICQSL